MIDNLNISTVPVVIGTRAAMSSEEVSVFTKTVSSDLAAASLVTNRFVRLFNTLPASFDHDVDPIDGAHLYVDNSASTSKDNGIFYLENGENSRPFTIYETFLFMLQAIANIDNGMKEGIRVGSVASPVSILAGATATYPWPYADKMFQPILFKLDGTDTVQVTASDVEIYVDNSSQIKITNNGASTIQIWGYLWHPVLSF